MRKIAAPPRRARRIRALWRETTLPRRAISSTATWPATNGLTRPTTFSFCPRATKRILRVAMPFLTSTEPAPPWAQAPAAAARAGRRRGRDRRDLGGGLRRGGAERQQ